MSFFIGAVSCSGSMAPAEFLDAMRQMARLFHRSDPKVWHGPGAALVHCQSLVTHEDKHERQPVVVPASGMTLVLDGRLDNRDELIRDLNPGSGGTGLPDSVVLAAAVDRWGDGAAERILGDFAFACWNPRTQRLQLVCDQMGGRVIYYGMRRDTLVFATMVNAVQGLLSESHSGIDEETLLTLLLDHGVDPEGTLYRGIRRLPPGGRLSWQDGSFSVGRYWEPKPGRSHRFRSDQEYVEAGRELLDRAVACRLRSAGPIAASLSGGLDSGAVASTAARLLAPGILQTVTASPEPDASIPTRPGRIADEWPLAKTVAQMYPNIRPHLAQAGGLTPEETDPTTLFLLTGSTPRNFLNTAWLGSARQQFRSLGASVVLTGVAGNMTLSWTGARALADYARQGRLLRVLQEVRALSRREGDTAWSLLRQWLFVPLTPVSVRAAVRRIRRGSDAVWTPNSPINPQFALDMSALERLKQERRLGITDIQGGTTELHRRQIASFAAGRANLACLRPHLGYEVRDPLGDVRLVEFCLSIPPEQHFRNGVRRRLARRVLEDRLPSEVVWLKGRGAQCADWFHRINRRRETILNELDSFQSFPLAARCLDLPRMRAIAENWPADAEAAEHKYADLVLVLLRGIELGRLLRWIDNRSELRGSAAAP